MSIFIPKEYKEKLEKYFEEHIKDQLVKDLFSIGADLQRSPCIATSAIKTISKEDCEKMMETLRALPKFVTKLEMAHTTRDLVFGEIKTEQSESMCGRFDGVEIWIDPNMATGIIKKVYNDGSSELEFLFEIDTTTYGIYKLD